MSFIYLFILLVAIKFY